MWGLDGTARRALGWRRGGWLTWIRQHLPVVVEGVALGEGDDLDDDVGHGQDGEEGADGEALPAQALEDVPGHVEQDELLEPEAVEGGEIAR